MKLSAILIAFTSAIELSKLTMVDAEGNVLSKPDDQAHLPVVEMPFDPKSWATRENVAEDAFGVSNTQAAITKRDLDSFYPDNAKSDHP